MKKTIILGLFVLLFILVGGIANACIWIPPPIPIPPPPIPTPPEPPHISHSYGGYRYGGTYRACVYDNTYLVIFRDLTPIIKQMNTNQTITLNAYLYFPRHRDIYYKIIIEKKEYGKCDYSLELEK